VNKRLLVLGGPGVLYLVLATLFRMINREDLARDKPVQKVPQADVREGLDLSARLGTDPVHEIGALSFPCLPEAGLLRNVGNPTRVGVLAIGCGNREGNPMTCLAAIVLALAIGSMSLLGQFSTPNIGRVVV